MGPNSVTEKRDLRFKQITATVGKQGELEIFGLTEEGEVFRYGWKEGQWAALPMGTTMTKIED